MKLIVLIILLVISSRNFSQLPTQGQIYNFSVGDVFEVKTHGSVYPLYELDTIVSKTINGDSIHYVIYRNWFINGPSPSSGQSTEYLNIDISQPAIITPPIYSCSPTIDSIFIGDCGQTIWHRETYFDACTFDPPIWKADLMEGLGGEYYWYMDPSNPNPSHTIWRELIYSNTQQWGVCGSYYSWFTGIDEHIPIDKIILKTIDLLGREIREKQTHTILIYIYSDGTVEKVFHTE